MGCVLFNRLLDTVVTPKALFAESAVVLAKLALSEQTIAYVQNPDWHTVDQDLKWLQQPDCHCITIRDESYPVLLKEIADPPPLLFIHGDPAALAGVQLAIVGSRNPSPNGYQIAYDFARFLAQAGLFITSGLAIGIDAASHRGALASQGITLAVAGTGLDKVYPAHHASLADLIVQRHGALVSELPLGTVPRANNFPRRNRLISGMSVGTLVVEAALRSGSLITARLALEQGREVFAIPGAINNPLARGCHALIKQGAQLAESIDDILSEVGHLAAATAAREPTLANASPIDKDHQDLLKYIAYAPTSVDTLVKESGYAPEAISSMLLILELQGYVFSMAGGCYCRKK